jgi:hypothetical protein
MFDCDGPTWIQTEDEIFIDKDVILDGEEKLTVDGRLRHRVFRVGPATARLIGITVTGGLTIDSPGGGIANLGGNLTLERCTVTRNFADRRRRFPTVGGDAGGGGIYNIGTLTIVDSTISKNGASPGYGDGILNGSHSAPLAFWPDVFEPYPGELHVINSTVSGNEDGEAIFAGFGTVTLRYSTVVGRIWNFSSLPNAEVAETKVTITKSIIDGDCGVPVISGGYNVEHPGDTCAFNQPTDQVEVRQPWIGVLRDNGGSTQTHALLTSLSVAVDAIPEADCVDEDGNPLTTDQRGKARPTRGGCDIGAFELQP